MAKEEAPATPDAPSEGGGPAGQPVKIDESNMSKSYANFCRVTPGFEELIIDFGLSPQPIGAPQPTGVSIDQRVIVNYFMAKRLLAALAGSVQRYEQIFGVLEVDVQKRVQPSAQPAQAPPPAEGS